VISQDVAVIFMAAGFLACGSVRRGWFWLALGGMFLAFVAVQFVRFGLQGGMVAGPVSGARTLAAVLVGSLAWLEALGRPRRLAIFLGLGLRSRALVFSNRLIAVWRPFSEAVNGFQVDPNRRAEALAVYVRQARELRGLRPPDPEWAHLRDDLADDVDATASLIRVDASADRFEDGRRALQSVYERWTRMNEAAAQAQRSLATPTRRRRGQVAWLATVGCSTVLIVLAEARRTNVVGLGLAAPNLILTVSVLAVGVGFLIAAVVVAIRH
jgi:hypothetical protein